MLDWILGCWHTKFSFPMRVPKEARKGVTEHTGTYVVCLKCGREFPYDWENMKVIRTKRQLRNLIHPNNEVA